MKDIIIDSYLFRESDGRSFIHYQIWWKNNVKTFMTDGINFWEDNKPFLGELPKVNYDKCDVTSIYKRLQKHHPDAEITKYLYGIKTN